jgi:hypothetical protein
MSVVYDCLWTWRRQFRANATGGDDAAEDVIDTEDKFPMRGRCSLSKQYSTGRKLTELAVHASSLRPKIFKAF